MTSHLSPMHITSQTAGVVLDLSTFADKDTHPSFSSQTQEFERIVRWVEAYPQRGSIHVYMRSAIRSATTRKMQSRLQALGCRVTARVDYPH